MNEIVKICKKHGELKENKILKHSKTGHLWCRICHNESQIKYKTKMLNKNAELYKEKQKKYQKKYRDKNKEKLRSKCRERCRNWYEKNKEKVREKNKKYIQKLTDNYVKNEIQRIVGKCSIPKEIIDIKRLHIKLKREIKKNDDQKYGST